MAAVDVSAGANIREINFHSRVVATRGGPDKLAKQSFTHIVPDTVPLAFPLSILHAEDERNRLHNLGLVFDSELGTPGKKRACFPNPFFGLMLLQTAYADGDIPDLFT